MSAQKLHTRMNLTKAEIASSGIIALTLLYVFGVISYNHSTPNQTTTFKIRSKRFIQEEQPWPFSYGSGRYRVLRSSSPFVPAHYDVDVQWGGEPYTLYVPLNKGPLLQGEKISFTCRILKSGRLHVVDYLDTHAQVDSVEIDKFGIFEIPVEETSDYITPRLVSQTDQIPPKVGIAFGYTFTVTGKPDGALTELIMEYSYPGLVEPGTNKTTHHQRFPVLGKISPNNFTCYIFEEEWELVPGKWIFSLKDGDRILAQKTFTVYKP